MKKPKKSRYLLWAFLIGVIVFIGITVAAIYYADSKYQEKRLLQYSNARSGLEDRTRQFLYSSADAWDFQDAEVIKNNPELSELHYGMALLAEASGCISVLYDETGEQVLADSSRAAFLFLKLSDDDEIGTYECEYNEEWQKIEEMQESAWKQYAPEDITYQYQEAGVEEEGVDSGSVRGMTVLLMMDEIYIWNQYFVPGKVHVYIKDLDHPEAEYIDYYTVDMTPEDEKKYERINLKNPDSGVVLLTPEPIFVGIDLEDESWQEALSVQEAFMQEYKEEIQKGSFGYVQKRFPLHHIYGEIGMQEMSLGDGIHRVLLTSVMEFSIFKNYGRQDEFSRFHALLLWGLVFLVLMLLSEGIAYILYIRARNTYEIWRYQVETTNAMAHDLKTPLMTISGYAENLTEQVHEEKRKQYVEGISKNITYMNHLIEDALELSKCEDAPASMNPEVISLYEFMEGEIENFNLSAMERGLTLELSGEGKAKTDPKALKSLVDNLLSNAVKYAAEETRIPIMVQNREIRIQNELDAPLGKTIEELKKPYAKGDNSRSGRQGSGLGLSIVEQMAKRMGCKVSYEVSKEEFRVRIRF